MILTVNLVETVKVTQIKNLMKGLKSKLREDLEKWTIKNTITDLHIDSLL